MGFTYSANIPQPGDFPSQSQDQILQNYQYLNVFGDRDHYMPTNSSTSTTGTHRQVTLTNIAAPAAGGDGALFADAVAGVSELFFRNTAGTEQLTGQLVAYDLPNTRGTVFLAGNLILNYGSGAVPANGSAAFTYATPFTGVAAYSITNGFLDAGSNNGTRRITVSTNTGFTFGNATNGAITMYYMAIGPA